MVTIQCSSYFNRTRNLCRIESTFNCLGVTTWQFFFDERFTHQSQRFFEAFHIAVVSAWQFFLHFDFALILIGIHVTQQFGFVATNQNFVDDFAAQ